MPASKRTGSRGRVLAQVGGYSLIEMVVAIGLAAIVGMGLYAVFNSQQRSSTSRRQAAELQTSCSFAMGQIKQELLLAGYRAEDSTTVRTFSAVHHKAGDTTNKIFDQITFEYFDDHAKFNDVAVGESGAYDTTIPWSSADYTALTQVRYELAGSNLVRHYSRWNPSAGVGSPPTGDYTAEYSPVLATNIQSLEFELMRDDNSPLLYPVSGAGFDQIRNIGIRLTCQAPTADKLTGRTPTITLTDSVKPRNVGLEANPRDTTPPAPPEGLIAWEPGICGTLGLRWSANTEADLGGYTIYYGFATGDYAKRIRVSRAPKAAGQYEEFTLTGLDATEFTDEDVSTYHIAVTAYDKSSNQSGFSTTTPEVSGNPTPSTTSRDAVASNGNDTTITMPAAPPITGFTATATPGVDGRITLTWPTSPVVGLIGYRIFRSADPAFVPNDISVTIVDGGGTLLANEDQLDATKTTWVDTGADLPGGQLLGCTPYYYRIAAIHCDKTIPTSMLNFAAASAQPTDSVDPPNPVLTARPGFRRIILTIQPPSEGAAADYVETRVWYSKTDYPTLSGGAVTGGELIPDRFPESASRGTFQGFGTKTVNFNDHDNGAITATDPLLDPDQTYYFIAVAYDRCGRNSLVTGEAKAEGAQCNDCLSGETCFGAPPPPENRSAEACAGPITVSWDYPYLSQTEVHRDLTGFHVFRREGAEWLGGTNEVELTSPTGDPAFGVPIWLTTFEDATAVAGKVYSYRVEATDCYYERRNEGWPLPGDDTTNSPFDNSADTFLSNVYTGAPNRQLVDISIRSQLTLAAGAADTTLNVLSTSGFTGGGNTVLIGSERISFTGTTPTSFTGCTRGVGGTTPVAHAAGELVFKYPIPPPFSAITGGLFVSPPEFGHHIVSLALENTAAGALTLNQLQSSWENSDAFLRTVIVGDGNTTPVTTSFSESPTLTKGSTGSVATLVNTPLSALDKTIPFTMILNNPDGTTGSGTNMRQDTMNLGLSWVNNSTGSQCPVPAAVSLPVTVPLGPYAGGVTMDRPSAGTLAVPVPGEGSSPNPMNLIFVPGGTRVHVFADVGDGSQAGIREVTLYYLQDPTRMLTAAPPVSSSASYPNLSPYTAIPMSHVAGNQWRTPVGQGIPISDTQNVWFFVLAVDNHGNFDREPEIAGGAFQYYQQQTDVCLNTPNAPGLSGTSSSAGVELTLTRPTLNTDGGPCTDFVGYRIFRKIGNGPYLQIATVPSSTTTATYTDVPSNISLPGFDYTYRAAAYDSCVPPKQSPFSSIFTECQGAPPCMMNLNADRSPIFPGDSLTIDLTVCSKQNGILGERAWVQDCSTADPADAIELIESGDTGTFRIRSSLYGGGTAVKTYLSSAVAPDPRAYPSPALPIDLKVDLTDLITVGGYTDVFPPTSWDSTCQSSTMACTATLNVVPDPCTIPPTTPGTPVITSINKGPQNCPDTAPLITLTWSPVPQATFYKVFRCSDSATCVPSALIGDNVTGTSFLDASPGGRLDKASYRYSVQAVANPCPAKFDPVPGAASAPATDPCF